MDSASLTLGLTFIGSGVLFILLAIPLLLEKIRMNRYYGVRFAKSFESEELWYKINKFGAKQIIYSGIILICFGVLFFIFQIGQNETLAILLSFFPIIAVLPAVIRSYLYAKKL